MSQAPTTPAGSLPRIGDVAPDFTAATTEGQLTLSEWQNERWVLLFSHPADFTPVCTTELAELARRSDEFSQRGVRLIGLSIDSIHSHLAWREDVRQKLGVTIDFPLIADLTQVVARRYGMLHAGASETATVRAVFVIDPERIVRAIVYYPLNVGRNVDELLRLIDALQTASTHSVSCPVNWTPGDDVIVPPPKTVAEIADREREGTDQVAFYLNKRPLELERV